MATPHAHVQAKCCSDGPGNPNTVEGLCQFGCAGPYLSLSRPTHALHRRFANEVSWREGERFVPHRGLPLPNPPTWLSNLHVGMFTWIIG